MENKPKNLVLLINGDKMRASVERGVEVPPQVHPRLDYAVQGYDIRQAQSGEYIVIVSFDGTDTKDYIALKTKAEVIGFLSQAIK